MNSRIGAWRFALRLLAGSLVCVAALSASFAATTTYTYDMHGRLTSATRDGVLQVTYAYDNAGNRISANATLQAALSNTWWDWYKSGSNPPILSPPIVVTATGGASGYTYAWQRISGDTQTTATAPSSNSTQWSRPTQPLGVIFTSTWRCLVTDSASGIIYTGTVTVTIQRVSGN